MSRPAVKPFACRQLRAFTILRSEIVISRVAPAALMALMVFVAFGAFPQIQ